MNPNEWAYSAFTALLHSRGVSKASQKYIWPLSLYSLKRPTCFWTYHLWPHIIIRRFICNIHATTTIHLHICPSYSWLILERFFIWHNFFNTLQTTPLIWIAHTSGVNSSNAKCYQRILQKIVKITRFFLSRMLLTKHEYSSAAKCCLANPAAAAS